MLQNQREANLLLKVSYDVNGVVTDARIDADQPKVHIDFVHSALRFARKMQFFVENVGGVAQGGEVFVPVSYKMAGSSENAANYTFRLPSGERLNMRPGEPKPEVTSTKTQASLSKPFVPQALTDG